MSSLPLVALVGRPNVGKSSLFNRLVGKKLAIVDDMPGLTRDRQEQEVRMGNLSFVMVDTPGLDNVKNNPFAEEMNAQTTKAVEKAAIVFFVVEGKVGLTDRDIFYCKWLRKFGKKVVVIINKSENFHTLQSNINEFYRLGYEDMIAVSATHNFGISEVYRYLSANINVSPEIEKNDTDLRLAIVGRPNVGKSTLINSILNEDRLLVGSEAGITRDSISIDFEFKSKKIKIFDTAGIRKQKNIEDKVEKFSVEESIDAIKFANVCALLLDANHPLEKQDLTIATEIIKEGRGLVLVVNKIDTITNLSDYKKDITEVLQKLIPDLRNIAVVYVSALKKKNIEEILVESLKVKESWQKQIPTRQLNNWISDVQDALAVPLNPHKKRPKLKFISQIKSKPPYFIIYTNYPDDIPLTYQRYLSNSLKEVFEINSCPVRIHFRKSNNPYAKE
jgi:GTP-binding protein